jgi:pimeloyl-ACP methyl ester carboxylesterase
MQFSLMKRTVWVPAGLALLCLFLWNLFAAYRADISAARERVASGSQIAVTRCGSIEYAIAGNGPVVLVAHGAGGGYDQGLDLATPLLKDAFRVIAVSRFGYLRSPSPQDASAAAQADAYACLLDALGIERVAILGASAGAPSVMQFALRYPARCTALVLLVPAAYVPRPGGAPSVRPVSERSPRGTTFLLEAALNSDFLFWLAPRISRATVERAVLGTPPEVIEHASPPEQARVAELVEHILPIAQRRLGLINDANVISSLPRYDLEHIVTPTLAISMADDLYGTYDGARYTAEHVPGARFIGYPQGGHLAVGHQQEIAQAIAAFLVAYADNAEKPTP